jgi:hypothetical protein
MIIAAQTLLTLTPARISPDSALPQKDRANEGQPEQRAHDRTGPHPRQVEENREHGAEGGTRGNAQRVFRRQRVAEQCLEEASGNGKRRTRQESEQRAREAEAHEDIELGLVAQCSRPDDLRAKPRGNRDGGQH